MSYYSFSSDFFTTAVGPKPRSNKTLRALTSNGGDTFFQELETGSGAESYVEKESYVDWLRRKREWDFSQKQVYLLNADVNANLMMPLSTYIQSFLAVPCNPLVVRSVSNGMRFVQEKSIPGSCGEGGCPSQKTATAATDVLAMLARTKEASSGAIVIALTSKNIFTECEGVVEVACADQGRHCVVSLSKTTEVKDAARLVLRAVVKLMGFVPCCWMKCIFNSIHASSSATLDIACPACLRRMSCLHDSASTYNYQSRYTRLFQWYNENKHCDSGESDWIKERFYSISGQELLTTPQECKHQEGETKTTSNVDEELSREEIRSKLKCLKLKKRRKTPTTVEHV
jgi:hypothetical protein